MRAVRWAWAEPPPAGTGFDDRLEAGALLGRALERYRGRGALVLGLPRGGVPVAAEVARHLEAELDVVVARKLGSPLSPEVAVGAVTADGILVLNDDLIAALAVPPEYIESVRQVEMAEAHRRERDFRGDRVAREIAGRVVIVVDDGLATGSTMRAALRAVRRQDPALLVAAVPVGAPDAVQDLAGEADEVVCLLTPAGFRSVGEHYADFRQVADAEVRRILHHAPRPP